MGQFIFLTFSLLVVALCLRGAKGCPYSWLYLNGRCYKVFSEQKTWHDAEMSCRTLKSGCHLASIHSYAASTRLANYIKEHLSGRYQVWIGLNDRLKTRTWEWSDGSSTNYFNWNKGEPNDASGVEYCVHLRRGSGFMNWNDIHCGRTYPFICQC